MNRFPLPILYLFFSLSIASGAQQRFEQSGGSEAPGPYVYDPIRGVSETNAKAFRVGQKFTVKTALQSGDSFSIEAFAKPDAELETKPRDVLPVFALGDDRTVLVAGIRRSPPPHSYQWWVARVCVESGPAVDLSRQRYKGISMVRGETPWRHVAVTWDAPTRCLSFYLDYRLQQSTILDEVPAWDLQHLEIGSSSAFERSFVGCIDEVRVMAEALQPWNFLRASTVPLTDVSFAPEAVPALPADYGHVDVRLHYGAVGDGQHDDTEAIRRAFAENENRVPIEYRTVYFPAGTYLISDSIRFSRFMVLRGAGREKTIIRLKDHARGYADSQIPKPVFAVGYDWPYVNRPKNNRAGNVIGNYVSDLAIETGSGNPATLGLDFHCNNVGGVENVYIRSGDGVGLVGLDLRRPWPGPCLIKNVSITGFDLGIAAAHREYSLVFSGISLRGQRVCAIRNQGNALSLENVVSENNVPAVENAGGGLVVLINSRLTGGTADETAVRSDDASLYLRNVQVSGYGKSVVETRTREGEPAETLADISDSPIEEYFTGPFDYAFEPDQRGSLKLEIKATPEIVRPSVDQWVNVQDFQDLVDEGDWAPAIQAAVDAGKPLVYFPPDAKYEIRQDVILRGAVRTFFGGSPKTGINNGANEDAQPADGPALVLGGDLPCFQFEMLNTNHVRHATPATLVFRHCGTGHITAASGCGDLFIEDAGGKWRFNEHQRVWARQLNPETKGVPEVINNGGRLWVLGLKTEYLSTKIENRDGAHTEVLGGLMYPVHPVNDESLPMFLNENSDISLVHAVSVYNKNHRIYIRDTQRGETREHRQWHWVSGRPISNLYRSNQ